MSIATETAQRSEGRQGLASMIRRVRIRNYKSIKHCDVELGPFTILVGRNGSGKSNFLDALRFLSDALWDGFDHVPWQPPPWEGIAENGARIEDVTIDVELSLPSGCEASYVVALAASAATVVTVRDESLQIRCEGQVQAYYRCHGGLLVECSITSMPPVSPDRLYLRRASDAAEFREVYDALKEMSIYAISPQEIRDSQFRHGLRQLDGTGHNLASAFAGIESRPHGKDLILPYLKLIVPDVADVRTEVFGPISPLVFEMRGDPSSGPRKFFARGMSDGTLRALGILVAINQLAADGGPIRLVGIEEPETALHPAAAGAMMGALRSAATHTQVLVTTHGSDLLDCYDPDEDSLLLATMSGGATRIAPIDDASRTVLARNLDTAGGLLRMDQLEPDPADLERQAASARSVGQNGDA